MRCPQEPSPTTRVWPAAWVVVLGWTVLVAVPFALNLRQVQHATLRMATNEARANFRKDLAFRGWAAGHGGVYVPVDEQTPPSPYLAHIPNRDITHPDGTPLTLMNPAYMVRQLNEDFAEFNGATGHITSLKLLRPENAPDEWERAALKTFERGEAESLEFTSIDGEPYLRLMQPVMTNEGCLKCHAHQGYNIGDVRGGVGVSLPMTAYLNEERRGLTVLAASYAGLWLLGICAILFTARHIRQRILSQRRSEKESRQSLAQYRSLVDNTLAVTYRCAHNTDWTMHYMSSAVESLTGYPASDFINSSARTFESVIHPEDSPRVARDVNESVTAGRAWEIEYRVRHEDGSVRWVYEKGHSVVGEDGEIEFLDGFLLDITERRRNATLIEQARAQADDNARRAKDALADMERMNVVMMGREERVLEMKREVNGLLGQLGQTPKYEYT